MLSVFAEGVREGMGSARGFSSATSTLGSVASDVSEGSMARVSGACTLTDGAA